MRLFNKKEHNPKPSPPPKVLVMRFSSIGDIVLTTPVIRGLKQQVPHLTLHYLTKHKFKNVLQANPHIDELLTFDRELNEIMPRLKAEGYTHLIDLHNNLRTIQVKRALSHTPAFTVNKLNFKKWLYVNFKWNVMPPHSIVDRYMATVQALGVRNDGQGLDYFIPERDVVANADIPMSHWAGYIACVIGGSYATKRMPVDKWKAFCAAAPYPIMLLGGADDRDTGVAISAIDPIKVYNACGKFNLNESADLVQRARLVITHDTGLMHVSAAFKKPIIALWGNTTPWFGMFPYYGFNTANDAPAQLKNMEVNNLGCRPCSKLGYNQCPKRHFKCMNEQNMEALVEWAKKFWVYPT